MSRKVHLVSLGCPKNTVDSEVMLGLLAQAGVIPTERPEEADVIVVNTCGFIDAAKEESVDTILEMATYKSGGRCQTLVVAGCLSQRYAPELAREIPEVDRFLGTGNFESIAEVVGGTAKGARSRSPRLRILGQEPVSTTASPRRGRAAPVQPYRHDVRLEDGRRIRIPDPDVGSGGGSPRLLGGSRFSTYLKVSEGCSNRCAFCVIPKLRGPQRSRPIPNLVAELEALLAEGVVEVNVVAQDLSAYGRDLGDGTRLSDLIRALDATAEAARRPVWIRLLYAYPRGLTREVLRAMARARHVLPYLDMPLQHISDRILRRMRRGVGGAATRRLIRRIREVLPQATLRTTFIAGLPGEAPEDFEELCAFVEETRFDHVGVFAYSREEDTPAARMRDQVPPDVAEARCERLMALQRGISREKLEGLVGTVLPVLVEGIAEETSLLLQGRHPGQAPEIDGLVYINEGEAEPGAIVPVRIEAAHDHDVAGGIVAGAEQPARVPLQRGEGGASSASS